MKSLFVSQIQERDWIETIVLVREKALGMAKNGKPYLTLKLMDRTGEIEGRVWDHADEVATLFDRDDFIAVTGKASVYLGKMQLIIQGLARCDEREVDLADFLPVAARPLDDMVGELQRWVSSFTDPHLRALLELFLGDEDFLAAFSRAPAAKAMHHVYLGGLLEHSLAVATLADDICRRYPGLNRDLLVTGALLHDVGKITELRYSRSFEYTDAGKLLGHIVIGVEIVDEKIRSLAEFPHELSILLKHLLLSHHGQYEFGSPKRPKTLEAVILNFIDDLDSKINGVRTHIGKEADRDSNWTQYHRLYDRYFFKGFAEACPSCMSEDQPEPLMNYSADMNPNDTNNSSSRMAAETRATRSTPFNNSLEKQLQGKTPSLFASPRESGNDV